MPIGIRCKGRCIFLAGRFANLLCGHLKDVVVLKIAKDKAWKENISELVQFYFEHLFPKIISSYIMMPCLSLTLYFFPSLFNYFRHASPKVNDRI